MKTLAKVGAALALIATLMTSGFYSYLKAEGDNRPFKQLTAAERAIKSETRPIAATITQLDISGPVDIKLVQGNTPAMTVRSEQRFLKKILTESSGNTITISFEGRVFRNQGPLEVEMTLPALQKLTIRGSGDAHITGFKGEQIQLASTGSGDLEFNGQYQRVNANLRGSGNMHLAGNNGTVLDLDLIGSGNLSASGQTKTLTTRLNGSGDIDAMDLLADESTVSLNGSGNTRVQAKQAITVNLRGSGDVTVKGNPSQRNISKAGSGEVDFE